MKTLIFKQFFFLLLLLLSYSAQSQVWTTIQNKHIANSIDNPANVINKSGSSNFYFIRNGDLNNFNTPTSSNYARTSFLTKSMKYGIGAEVFTNNMGIGNMNGLGLDYAYRVKFNREKFLSFGVKFGMYNLKQRPNSSLPAVNENGQWKSYAQLGATYHLENSTLEMSIPQLLMSSENYQFEKGNQMFFDPYLKAKFRHNMDLKNIRTVFSPEFTFYAKSPNQIFQMGFTANYDKNYFIHADYSFQHSARLSFGVQVLDGLQLSYSIQKMFESDFTGRSSSHEILIGYTINRKKTDNSKLTQSLEELFAPKHTGKNVTTTAMRMDQGSKGDELASTRQYMANPSAVRLDSNNLAIIRQNATANRKSVVVNTSGKVKLQKDLNDTTSTKYDQLFVKSYSTTDLLRQRSLPITNADRFVYDFQKIKEDKTLLLFGVYTSQALAEENRAKINNSGIEVHENSNNGLFYLILPCKTKMNEEEFKSTWASINSSNTKFWVLDFTN